MSYPENDRKIRQLYDTLRQEDRARTPSFEAVLERGGRSAHGGFFTFLQHHRVAVVAVALLAVALPFLVQMNSTVVPDENLELELYQWEAPTDFLLTTDSDSDLEQVPTFDLEVPSWVSSAEFQTYDQ